MYSTVSVRIGVSWSVEYCVNEDRDLLVCTVLYVSVRMGISWSVQYCVNEDRDLL